MKLVYKFIKNYLPNYFDDYVLPASKIHNYSSRFASEYNWVAVIRCCSKTLSQQFTKIEGHRLWKSLPEETKKNYHLNNKVLLNNLKKILLKTMFSFRRTRKRKFTYSI